MDLKIGSANPRSRIDGIAARSRATATKLVLASGEMFGSKAKGAIARSGIIGLIAVSTLFATAGGVAAAGVTLQISSPVCDASTWPLKIWVAPPVVTAMDDSSAVDQNYIRYWVRLYDGTTGAVVTGWTYGGQTLSTDVSPGAFPMQHTVFGTSFWVSYATTSSTLRVQYSIAWYRTDWSLRASNTYTPNAFKYEPGVNHTIVMC